MKKLLMLLALVGVLAANPYPPYPAPGCDGEPQLICDENGDCKWVFVDCI